MKDIKFEYAFAILVVVVLTAALFVFKDNRELVTTVVTALVGALSAITAFFFTKTQVSQPTEQKEIPVKIINPKGEITNDIR